MVRFLIADFRDTELIVTAEYQDTYTSFWIHSTRLIKIWT